MICDHCPYRNVVCASEILPKIAQILQGPVVGKVDWIALFTGW